MNYLKKYNDWIIVAVVAVTGTIMRFYHATSMSFSNDELSALSRLQFDNLSDLINLGIKTDGHPAGVQLFLYFWTKIFGLSVFSIRFPFIIAGAFSIILFYKIALKWIGRQPALFATVSIAFIEYTIFYSQLARPYSFGLFVSLLNLYYWTKLFVEKKYNYKVAVAYALSIALAAYIHYFSFLTVIFIGAASLFFVSKKNIKYFIVAIVLSILLYLPHLSVFFAQIEIGGVGGWLSKPKPDFIWEYLFYVCNDSYLVLGATLGLIVILFALSIRTLRFTKLQVLSLFMFLLPFLTGYFYSVYKNPVLQYSVLIFSFPFLLIFIFSFFKEIKAIIFNILLVLFSLTLIYSTAIEKNYYNTEHFGEFKKIAKKIEKWNSDFGKENITNSININKPYYIQYYLPKDADSIHFEQYRIETQDDFLNFTKTVKNSKTPYFSFAWSNVTNMQETIEYIKIFYPYIIEMSQHFNSEIYLFSKEKTDVIQVRPCFSVIETFEEYDKSANLDSTICYDGTSCFKFTDGIEYGPSWQYNIPEFNCKFKKMLVHLKCYSESGDLNEVLQVISIDNNGKSKYWKGMKYDYFADNSNEWFDIVQVFTFPIDFEIEADDVLKTYTWNKGRKSFYIDSVNIQFFVE